MDLRVHIPYRPDGGQRDRLYEFCCARWQNLFPDAKVITGHHEGDPFNRSAARNAAAEGDWDLAVFADADVTVDRTRAVTRAVALARGTGHMVFCHSWRHGLDQAATEQVLSKTIGPENAAPVEKDRNTFSGVYVVPRSLWDAVGGFDERYIGWGFEDLAFFYACEALGGVSRVPGTVIHLWHPRSRADQEEQPHYRDNETLWRRYLDARFNASAMRALLQGRDQT